MRRGPPVMVLSASVCLQPDILGIVRYGVIIKVANASIPFHEHLQSVNGYTSGRYTERRFLLESHVVQMPSTRAKLQIDHDELIAVSLMAILRTATYFSLLRDKRYLILQLLARTTQKHYTPS
ncbi:hypothetical protein EVAR_81074_1 [Eumeta japonica]|uniref:Uncharacterized protein n=1 Tax=Eumeta variegata TaxID=151549 RepID=A0A4C1T8C4_EUMVA|nr:hypothetical protein EVAR_81074_1 [Eumeta japonica]